MTSVRRRIFIGGVLLAGAIGYLGFAGVRSGWVYLQDVDAFVQSHPRANQRTRVYGVVSGESSDIQRMNLVASFDLVGHTAGGSRLRVVYRGPIPDQFQTGREVVVEGALDDQGAFQADVLMTKCASKYESMPQSSRASSGGAETHP
jgi:cytochrome c-type biogenesis protein CcmE